MYHMQFPRRPLCHVFGDVFFSLERGGSGDTAGECGVNILTQPLAFRSLRASVWKGKNMCVFMLPISISFYKQILQSKQNKTKKTSHVQDRQVLFNGHNHSGFEMRTVLLHFLTDKATVKSPI